MRWRREESKACPYRVSLSHAVHPENLLYQRDGVGALIVDETQAAQHRRQNRYDFCSVGFELGGGGGEPREGKIHAVRRGGQDIEPHRLGLNRSGRTRQRRVDGAGLDGRQPYGHVARRDDGKICRVDAVVRHHAPGNGEGNPANTAQSDDLAFEIAHGFDPRLGNHVKTGPRDHAKYADNGRALLRRHNFFEIIYHYPIIGVMSTAASSLFKASRLQCSRLGRGDV